MDAQNEVTAELDGLELLITRSDVDGAFVVDIIGPAKDEDLDEQGQPKVRIYLNDATVYENPPFPKGATA